MAGAPVQARNSFCGFVLAGGRSSRMGADKALAHFHGTPLTRVALNAFTSVGILARIAGSRSPLNDFAQEIPDTWPESGPLGGIHSALSASQSEWNVFLPVDLPLMPASLLACLLQRAMLTGATVTVARMNGRIEPFPVVLHRDALPIIQRRLESGQLACHSAWQAIPADFTSILDSPAVENLVQCGHCAHPLGLPPVLWFRSANTPQDLALLNKI